MPETPSPFEAPNQAEYDGSLVDTAPLREHLAAEHSVAPEDVFIRAVTAQRVYYSIGPE